jgi:membrane protein CcdC involved in cytochrome C biogenesis
VQKRADEKLMKKSIALIFIAIGLLTRRVLIKWAAGREKNSNS